MKSRVFLLTELVAMAAMFALLTGCGGGSGGSGTKGENLPPIGANYTIQITHANLGSDDTLRGTVTGGKTNELKVVVYICVDGKWWTKPYYDTYLTTIAPNGNWECFITLFMRDYNATEVLVFLVDPKTATIPILSGNSDKPVIPEALASTGYVKP